MPLLRIEYDDGMPPEVRSALDPLIEKWKHIVPAWCQRIWCSWSEDNEQKCQITVREDQRDALLSVHPNWMTLPHEREVTIIHELCHFYNSPLRWEGADCIKLIVGNDHPTPGSRIAESRLTECCERQNNDLVALVLGLSER